MDDAAIIRSFRFRAVKRGFDEILRTVMLPDLRAFPGLVDVTIGRQGPDEDGPRILVTTWSSMEAMVGSVSETGVDAFMTVSAWCTWDDVEQATGGDVHRPLATRKPERLVGCDVEYYEIIPT